MRKVLQLIALLLTACLTQVVAADYVDKINNEFKTTDGKHVIYELNVGMFTQAGTFKAAQAKLAELKTLGVDIVWLMPIYPRGGGANSPYAATDFKAVNSNYGTIADLKDFVAAAHALDMQVWLDWVPNHTATNAKWVTEHPEYYAKSGGQMIHPNNYNDVWQLDYNNSGLVNAMNDCLKFWIDQADIDGYRCDYISSPRIPATYWQTAIPMIKSYKSGKTITFLGETDIVNDATLLQNVGFDYDYAWNYQGTLATFGGNGVYSASLRVNANNLVNNSKDKSFGRMLYLTNHDINCNDGGKTLTQLYGNNRYPLTVLVGTLYGMPLIYNGQETGGNQILDYFNNDTKINWNSVDEKMRNTLRTLSALKHAVPALSDKAEVNMITFSDNNNVLAFTRTNGESKVLVVLNMATTNSTFNISGLDAGEWSQWLTSETISQGTSRKKQTFAATQSFTLEGKGYRVYVKGSFSEEDIPALEVYTPTLESASEMALFFETAEKADYRVWAWGNGPTEQQHLGITGEWSARPAMKLMGAATNGHFIYKFVFQGSAAPANFIITKNGDNPRPHNGTAYVKNGYYVEDNVIPAQVITAVTGIQPLITNLNINKDNRVYTLSGKEITNTDHLLRGIYIRNGQKFVVRQ